MTRMLVPPEQAMLMNFNEVFCVALVSQRAAQ